VKPEDIAWSKNLFNSLSDGGSWAVPRSGLIFTKRGKQLVLTATMPHDPAMPVDAAQLKVQQDADFRLIKEHFGAAGIEVVRQVS